MFCVDCRLWFVVRRWLLLFVFVFVVCCLSCVVCRLLFVVSCFLCLLEFVR